MTNDHFPRLLAARVQAIQDAYESRDEAIRRAYQSGMPASAIADAVGLSRQQVWRIVRAS